MANETKEEPNIFQGMGNEVIAEFRGRPAVPQYLYHYTSAAGFMGIMGNDSIWYSDAAYMNDGSEIMHGFKILRIVLDEYMREKSDEEKEIAQELLRRLEAQAFFYRQVIFCLCEQDNLLNQWRDYGRDIVPYSIQFDIRGLVAADGWNFRPVLLPLIYDHNNQINVTRSLIDRIYQRATELKPEERDTEAKQNGLYNMAVAEIQWVLYQFKNEAFAAEKEWRMMGLTPFIKQAPKFRASNLGVVPYYEWKRTTEDRRLPITKVTVGPSPYAQVSDLALKQFLKVRNYEVPTEYSTIPIRR